MHLPIHPLLILGLLLLTLGLVAPAFLRRHLITLLIALELALLGLNTLLVAFSLSLNDPLGQLMALTVLTIAGAESSIGLALLVVFHRLTGLISPAILAVLKG